MKNKYYSAGVLHRHDIKLKPPLEGDLSQKDVDWQFSIDLSRVRVNEVHKFLSHCIGHNAIERKH